MICPNYATMRAAFAVGGASVAADGHLEFPGTAKLRTGGFTGLATPTIAAYPFTITCNAGAADAVAGTHEYDWFLSQRTDVAASQYLEIIHSDPLKSGTVRIDIVDANVALLLPGLTGADLLTDASQAIIFANCHLYVSRRSDKAYQWIRLVSE